MDISKLTDGQKIKLVNARWASSETLADEVKKLYEQNLKIYQNQGDWVANNIALRRRAKIRANRIFRNQESVINALIANPPQPNFIPTREGEEARDFADLQQRYFLKKYKDLNVKEQLRKGLRNLYFARLIVLKPFWNPKINDFDVRSVNPKNIRISIKCTKEEDTEYVIEEITDTLVSAMTRFPKHKDALMRSKGYTTEDEAFIANPEIQYKEAWIGDNVLFVYEGTLLAELKNPYWDWDGLLVTSEEERELKALGGEQRRAFMSQIREQQEMRKPQNEENPGVMRRVSNALGITQEAEAPQVSDELHAYYFNHFDFPRKPYIFATIFNNEQKPIGQTDMITQAAPLQEGIDRRKQDIDENASLVNGQVKVDSTVMSKADAQKLRFEARGVIWGKGVKDGVGREMGNALPQFVYDDMVDSRNEIDNIMAASAAFRGEREGQETKAGRLALIDQSYLALNELVQVVDYCSYELFNWFYQLAKVRYTEHHEAKLLGKDNALKIFSLMQDDFEDGTEIRIIEGKTLPEDRQFKYEQAQVDAEKGFLSPVDYLEVAGYESPSEKAKNAVVYKINPAIAAGISPEEMQQIAPQNDEKKPPSVSISFKDLPIDGQVQAAEQAGITLDPQILVGEKMAERKKEQDTLAAKQRVV